MGRNQFTQELSRMMTHFVSSDTTGYISDAISVHQAGVGEAAAESVGGAEQEQTV